MVRDGCGKERKWGVNPAPHPGAPRVWDSGSVDGCFGEKGDFVGKLGFLGGRKAICCLPIHLLGGSSELEKDEGPANCG